MWESLETIAQFKTDLIAGVAESALVRRVVAPIVKNRRISVLQKRTAQANGDSTEVVFAIDRQTSGSRLK